MSNLISYTEVDCEYSLFISYAHKDDSGNDRWVHGLKDAIFQRLDQLQFGIPIKKIHFSGENGPVGGTLGSELEDRVKRSFAMLLVVGKQYVDSKWCERELELFEKIFPTGTKSRLYIAIMGENHLIRVGEGEKWKRIVAPDQIWTEMYRKEDKDRPLEHRMADGSSGFPPEFRNCAYRLADRLIKEIEIDWKKSENIANEPPDGIGNVTQATWVPASSMHKKLRVAIGPHTDSFELSGKDQPLTLLRQALEAAGAEVVSLDSKKLLTYNPTDGRPLRPELRNADVLLVPVLEEQPLRPDIPGGHTSILTSEWAELKKPQKSLVWYRPPPEDVCPGELADPPHLEAFKKLAPICSSPQAVVNLLFGAGASDVIRIYIENDDAVPMYSLGDVLENAWAEFRKVAGEKLPNLKYEPVRLNQLDELLDDVPRDVAAIVLLHIKGHTPERSLRTREQIVENSFPKSGHFYPGLVALVFSPPKPTLDPKPNHSWGDVTLYRTENDVDLELDVSSQVLLKQFLRKMWQQYQKA